MTPIRAMWVFFLYGAVLAACGMIIAGAGHGILGFLTLVGSPFWFLGLLGSTVATIAQWPALAFSIERERPRRYYVVIFLLTHYGVGIFGARLQWQLGDATALQIISPPTAALLVFALVWYLVGQVWIWRRLLERNAASQEHVPA